MTTAASATHGRLSRQLSYTQTVEVLLPELNRRDGLVALVLVELFDVSTLQARLGFEASGQLLDKLEAEFLNALQARGVVTRLGDSRFCVILHAVRNSGHAVLAGQKLLRVADEVMTRFTFSNHFKICAGVALFPWQANDAESLLQTAQLAAAAAKSRGVRVLVYDEACGTQIVKPWQLGEAFAKALDAGELSVFYQPKICLRNLQTAGVEALMRWLRDDQVVATPDVFIPLAEEAGLIQNATWYAISNALRLSSECGGLPVAVNISPGLLHHREFVNMFRAAIATWGVLDERLTLEITEGGLIVDVAQATERLNRLRELGVRISIDDFGTGYSSLSYFKKIPADELKIDKSFIKSMTTDASDQRLVQTILDLASQFNLATVAEGVEDRQTLEMLGGMGCEYAQGFLFAPALNAEELKHWLRDNPYGEREYGAQPRMAEHGSSNSS